LRTIGLRLAGSPGGRHIAFDRLEGRSHEIYAMSAGGSGRRWPFTIAPL
jgi:hypothetical protein